MTAPTAVATRGRFVWFDLQTTDIAAAVEFYTKLFGWGTMPFDMGPLAPPYFMWTLNGMPFGGIMQAHASTPTSWLAYVATPDVDATAREVTRLGGTLLVPPTDIPTVGRFTILSDPQGPVIAAFTTASAQPPGHDGPPNIGEFGWHELATGDHEKAFAFYHTLFGWDRGPTGPMAGMDAAYQMFSRNEQLIGGMYNKPASMPVPNHWVHYVAVSDVDATAARVPSLGGMIAFGPVSVPDGPRIAMCGDPQGAMFALYNPPG